MNFPAISPPGDPTDGRQSGEFVDLHRKFLEEFCMKSFHVYLVLLLLVGAGIAQTSSADKGGKALEKRHKKNEAAVEKYRQALRSNPDDSRAQKAICRILEEEHDFRGVVEQYRSWIDNHPTDFDRVSGLASVFEADLYDPESAIDVWRTYLSQNPPPAPAAVSHDLLGKLLLPRGRYSEAIAELRDAIELNSDPAEWHDDLARALEANGDLNEALQEFRTVSYLSPHSPEPHYSIARLLHKKGDLEGELTEFRAALSVSTNKFLGHVKLAILLLDRGDKSAAEEQFKDALAENPKSEYVLSQLARLLPPGDPSSKTADQARTTAKAKPKHGKGPKPDPQPTVPARVEAEGHYRLGTDALAFGDSAMAAAELHQAVRLDPADARYHKLLGMVLADKGGLETEAIHELRAGLTSADSEQAAIEHHTFGLLLLKLKRDQEAMEELRRAYALMPTNLTFRVDYERLQAMR
jgi:tetratricopeptide (TPR) repeat protein